MKRSTRRLPVAALMILLLALSAPLSGCAIAPPDGTPTPGVTTPGVQTPTASPTSAAPQVGALIYFPRDSTAGVRLARERHPVPADRQLDGAIEAMLAGPSDPDYLRGWAPGTRLLGATTTGDVTTVDLSAEARTTTLGSEASAALVDQLVWTVTEVTGPASKVALTIEGKPAGELWGVLTWDSPQARRDALDVRVPVAIDSPLEGVRAVSPVLVSGNAAVFEATLPWRVLDAGGHAVLEGTTMTEEGQAFSDFSFDVGLPPGTYVVEIREDDPSGGAAGPVDVDTRTIVITG